MSDINEKVQFYSTCCGGQVIVEDHCELEESNDKERHEYSGEDLTLLTELFSMSPSTPNKNLLDFLSNYYFNTKSPVAFTSPLALYREAKERYPSLTFRQVRTWLQFKDSYTLHKPVRYNFQRNRVIVTRIDDQWQADLVDVSSLARFNKGYEFVLTCIFEICLGCTA